ncbi:MAG: nucleotidyl transferase AbiEii/AbiGii toxin family protein [Peptostreptococcaceae bacterium]|nr:nucleotidyl transferase AbiEii/AbiGii toxin family protein [Peptostreptococcaceae bacterium]
MLHLSTIDPPTLELLKKLMSFDEFSGLRLVGGTALALQIGHRKSIDLDFFGKVDFEAIQTGSLFARFDTVEVIQKTKNINVFEINGVKVDFVNYSYPWLQDTLVIDGIRLALEKDLAAMKIAAITGRGRKKDFVDMYFLLKEISFTDIISLYNEKYFDASTYLALKSLTYFDDAEQDMDLDMIEPIEWIEVKKTILKEVKDYSGV